MPNFCNPIIIIHHMQRENACSRKPLWDSKFQKSRYEHPFYCPPSFWNRTHSLSFKCQTYLFSILEGCDDLVLPPSTGIEQRMKLFGPVPGGKGTSVFIPIIALKFKGPRKQNVMSITYMFEINTSYQYLESCSNFQHAALWPCFPEIIYSFSDLNYRQNKSRNRNKHLRMWFSRIAVSREHSKNFYQPLAHSYVTALSLGSPRFKSILIHGNSNPILRVPKL